MLSLYRDRALQISDSRRHCRSNVCTYAVTALGGSDAGCVPTERGIYASAAGTTQMSARNIDIGALERDKLRRQRVRCQLAGAATSPGLAPGAGDDVVIAHVHGRHAVALTHQLAARSRPATRSTDRTLRLWEVASGRQIARLDSATDRDAHIAPARSRRWWC